MSGGLVAAVLASARKDLVRRSRDRLAFALWLGIPLAIGGLMSLAMGGSSGPRPRARVLVVDHDASFVSGALFQGLASERAQVFEAEKVEEADGRARLLAGKASALLVIPAEFGDAVLREQPTRLELITNPAQRILPGMVEEALEILRELVFYAHRIVGEELRTIVDGADDPDVAFDEANVAALSVRIQRRIERLSGSLFPPLIELEQVVRDEHGVRDEQGDQAPQPSLGALFFPSMLLMALFFVAQGLGEDLWREKVLGLLRRASVGPQGTRPLLAGKLVAAWVLMLVIALVAGLLGVLAFGVALERALAAAAWASAVGVLLTLLMFLLGTLAKSQRAAGLVTNLVLFPLLMIGGSFFPFEIMPDWMQAVGRFTPNGWGMGVLKTILDGSASAASIFGALGVFALVAGALYAVCELRLRGAFART